MNKKIGILTVYSFNYGSFFQATALYKQLESMGYEPELINERFKKFRWGNLFLLYSFDDLLPSFAKKFVARILPQYRTYLQLKNDIKNFKESSPRIHNMRKITKGYDAVVLGADEMWSATKKSIRYMPEHFGERIEAPHFTYGTCGSLFDVKNKELKQKAKRGIHTYYAYGVRDTYTKSLVKLLTGNDATEVLDPTLLNPYFIHEYEPAKEPYILLYGSEYSEEQRAYIKAEAARLGCKIASLGWPQDFSDIFLDPVSADEFQGCFAKAIMCFPSTFHGTIFSILNHRPFLSMTNELRGRKVKMLLKSLNMTDRIYRNDISEYPDIDYDKVEEVLAAKREESLSYLKKALNGLNDNEGCTPLYNANGSICEPSNCTGCGACASKCPKNAISMKENSEGFMVPVIDETLCSSCDLCKKVCPANKYIKELAVNTIDNESAILAAYADKDNNRMASASGGAAYTLARNIIKMGGVVYGAAYDEDFSVRHIRCINTSDIKRIRGSKYVQSNQNDIYKSVREDLLADKYVMYFGTPCQITGLKGYLGTDYKKLLTVDIVCHGVPSPRIWREYLRYMTKKHGAAITSVNFRNKRYGWQNQALSMEFANGASYLKRTNSDPYYIMFFGHYMLRRSCNECKYASYMRCSDITLGDYWGVEKLKNRAILNVNKGVSLVIPNTSKGQSFINNAEGLVMFRGDKSSSYQPIFERGSIASKRRNEFFSDYRKYGFNYVCKKYGRLTPKQVVIKKVIAPIVKKLHLYDFASKVFFVKRR